MFKCILVRAFAIRNGGCTQLTAGRVHWRTMCLPCQFFGLYENRVAKLLMKATYCVSSKALSCQDAFWDLDVVVPYGLDALCILYGCRRAQSGRNIVTLLPWSSDMNFNLLWKVINSSDLHDLTGFELDLPASWWGWGGLNWYRYWIFQFNNGNFHISCRFMVIH